MSGHEEAGPEADPEPDVALAKNIGEIILGGWEHDPFIDGLQGRLWEYPEDAP